MRALWVKTPQVPFAGVRRISERLHETVIKGEVVADGIFPSFGRAILAVIRKLLLNVFDDAT